MKIWPQSFRHKLRFAKWIAGSTRPGRARTCPCAATSSSISNLRIRIRKSVLNKWRKTASSSSATGQCFDLSIKRQKFCHSFEIGYLHSVLSERRAARGWWSRGPRPRGTFKKLPSRSRVHAYVLVSAWVAHRRELRSAQGDQVGRIFAHWTLLYYGILFLKSHFCVTFCYFFHKISCKPSNFDKIRVGLHFGRL
jgi:hypothetical protein